jgi:hypothetical protein
MTSNPYLSVKAILAGFLATIVVGLSCVGIVKLLDDLNVSHVTSQAQSYMDRKAIGTGISIEVEDCVALPSKVVGHKPNWACRVTAVSGEDSEIEIIQFTPNNLAGKLDPVEKSELKFDHSKDRNI